MNALLAAASRTGSQQPAAIASAAEDRLEPAAAPPPPAGDAVCPLPHTDRAASPAAVAADAARQAGAPAFLDILRMAGEGTGPTGAEAQRADEAELEAVDADDGRSAVDAGLATALFDPTTEHLRLNDAAPRRGGEKEGAEVQSPVASLAATLPASVSPFLATQDGGRGRPTAAPAAPLALAGASVTTPAAPAPGAMPAAPMPIRGAASGGAPSRPGGAADDLLTGSQSSTAGGPAPLPAPLSPAGELVSFAAPAARATGGAEAPLRLPNGAPAGWRQPLADALGDRLQLQLGSGSERAVIRLDPPMMGSVEIVVRHEAGSVQVQLTATHGEVLRQLHAIADGLRQDLVGRQYAEVSVNVADGSRDPGGRQRQGSDGGREGDNVPGRGLADDGHDESSTFSLA